MIKQILQALFSPRQPDITAGMRVNLADAYRPERCDGIVEALRGRDALVAWSNGGSSWERAADLYPLATD